MYLIKNVRTPLVPEPDLTSSLAEKFKIERSAIGRILIRRRSLDARKKNQVEYNFTLLADLPGSAHPDLLTWQEEKPYLESVLQIHDPHPFIIGTGPAGLFCALGLVEKGYRPWLFDRGDSLHRRQEKVNDFWRTGNLDPESNVQFGEGGAGTFSDGKLTARNRDFYSEKIFGYLVQFGANPDIRIDGLPHLGTDGIRLTVSHLRAYLEEKGCRFFWNHCLNSIEISHSRITSVIINQTEYKPEILILAIGNAARDTFSLLNRKIRLENKPFALGVRIEHSQEFLNRSLYGEKTNLQLIGPATYRLTSQCQGRGVYSFCMCPGGYVIAASSEVEHLVLNGMSFSSRNHSLANSALVVGVDSHDLGNDPLAGISWQREMEARCFRIAGKYQAPIQPASDFIRDRSPLSHPLSSYRPAIVPVNLNSILPPVISQSLQSGLQAFERKIPGFCREGLLLAPETRTSSPVRIRRDPRSYLAEGLLNLYPIGEGAGYAGGIISSATDGYKLACLFKPAGDKS